MEEKKEQHRVKLAHATIDVDLTEEQVRNYQNELVKLHSAIEEAKEELASIKKQHQTEINRLESQQSRLYRACVSKKETQTVHGAIHVMDLNTKTKWIEYNGKKYELRDLSPEEILHCKNRPLFDEEGKANQAVSENKAGVDPNVANVVREETKVKEKVDHVAH